MTVELSIPSYLKKYTGDNEVLRFNAGTIFSIIEQINKNYPDLADKLLENGSLKSLFMLFSLNNSRNDSSDKKNSRITDFNTIIKDGQRLKLLSVVAGG
jgi:molybdopterin converting factor small subunit